MNSKFFILKMLVLVAFFSISSCIPVFFSSGLFNCKYTVTNDFIESSCKDLYNSFQISKIKVDSMDNGLPSKYKVLNTVWWGAKNDSIYSIKREVKMNIVHFYEEQEGYRWYDVQNGHFTDVFPIIFEQNNWYIVTGLNDNTIIVYLFYGYDELIVDYQVNLPTNY